MGKGGSVEEARDDDVPDRNKRWFSYTRASRPDSEKEISREVRKGGVVISRC